MAIKNKTKMGSMVGMSPTDIKQPLTQTPVSPSQSKDNVGTGRVASDNAPYGNSEKSQELKGRNVDISFSGHKDGKGGRPVYELFEGEEEKTLNVKIPKRLDTFIAITAKTQGISVKQLVNETLRDVMVEKYGFRV